MSKVRSRRSLHRFGVALALAATVAIGAAACQPSGNWTLVLEDDYSHYACAYRTQDANGEALYVVHTVSTRRTQGETYPPFAGIVRQDASGQTTWVQKQRTTPEGNEYWGTLRARPWDRVYLAHNDDIVNYWAYAKPVTELEGCAGA